MVRFKYCPQCRSKLNTSGKNQYCGKCRTTYYRNSKPCCGILPFKKGKVLLSKRAAQPHKGAYDIIGGFLKEGEHPEDGAIREAKEETGLDLKVKKLLGIYIDRYGKHGDYTLNIHYIGEVVGGKMKAKEDIASLHWVPIIKVPANCAFKNTYKALEGLKNWYTKKK